jgi:uncharacterized SAM-binding protein YcdF (DUF218 family)
MRAEYEVVFYLKKLIAALVLPPTGPVLVALLGLWLARRHRRLGSGIAILMLLSLVALALPPVAEALMGTLETYPPIAPQQLSRAQAIVVLGGDDYPRAPEYGGDTVGPGTLSRVRYAAELQRRSGLPILVSGGAPAGGTPGGETMKAALERDFGGNVKWVERASRDTAENAAYSAGMLKSAGVRRIALVSHGWHLRRAIPLFERQGFEVVAAPTRFTTHSPSLFFYLIPDYQSFEKSTTALRELLGILAQRVAAAAT